ncbi:MAG: ASKHA domain-containing protein [Actinobacteria bacterium]|nr:ASKHA domain-containing protein [Actinomycetota bacterium]
MNGNRRIDFQPVGRRIYTHDGADVYLAAREDGVGLTSLCAGEGTCGKCKIRVVSGEVSPLHEREREALSVEEIAQGYRLACLTQVHGDIRVEIPLESFAVSQRVELSGQEKTVVVDPVIRTLIVELTGPSQTDNRSDQARLVDHLSERHGLSDIQIDLYAQRRLSVILRENEWRAKLGLHGNEVVMAGRVEDRVLGLAVDLGTTSIAAYLTDLETGEALAAKGMMNPQIAYGEDVISRISYAIDHDGEPLRQIVVEGINKLIGELCSAPGLAADGIAEVVLVGNTAMHHLLLGLPVRQLLLAPYVAAVTGSLYTKCRDVGVLVSSGASIYTMPNIGSFVGADHVAMLLASELNDSRVTALGIDIGTNTEITLSANGRLSCCSCASGPAFEGAHIKNGMRAVAGAIEKVKIEGDSVTVETINQRPPVGLCGSGVLDAVAQLLENGIIDTMGKLGSHPRVQSTDKGKEFVLAGRDESGTGKEITLTEKDIGEIQLAKGAIASGISILLQDADIAWHEIDEVVIAGAFGTYIDVASAVGIGMLPPLPLQRFSQVGNAAGVGAKLALISKAQRRVAMDIAQRVNHVELTRFTGYPRVFANALRFAPARNWKDNG